MVWIAILLLLYLGILAFAVWISFHPFRTPIFISPGALLAPQEDVELSTGDGVTFRAWWVGHGEPKGAAILVHGYMMNRSELTPLAVWLHQRGWSSLIVDLRAHGRSGGKRSTFGVLEKEEVLASMRWVRSRHPEVPIVLMGSSMGAAASVFAAAAEPEGVAGLILDSVYGQLPKAVLGWWYFLGGRALQILLAPTVLLAAPIARFNPFKIDVADSLRRTRAPVLFLHGTADTLARPDQAERNFAACEDRATIVWLPNCGHSEGRWIHPDQYHEALDKFLNRVEVDYVRDGDPRSDATEPSASSRP